MQMEDKILNLKSTSEHLLLKKGESAEFKFLHNEPSNCKLFFSCEDASWSALKNESGAELLYMLIDDSLNYEEAEINRFCLDFSCTSPLPFAKRAVKKIKWQPLNFGLFSYDWFNEKHCDAWQFGIYAKAENLRIEEGGYLRVRVDKWLVKDEVNPNDTTNFPDETCFIDISEGTYCYKEFKSFINAGRDETACIIVTVEGENYSGKVFFERPFLSDASGINLLPEFDRGIIGIEHAAWLGQNLSKREWPRFKVDVNGVSCFEDEVFLKVHRFSPIEISLKNAPLRKGENTISITYTSDYIDTIPVLIDEVYLLESEITPFKLIKCPEEVTFGKRIALLAETDKADAELSFESDDFNLREITRFDEFNLQVISIEPSVRKNNLTFKLTCGEKTEQYTVKRCIEKIEDNVISGSGDMIYIDISDIQSVCDYIKWYVSNDVGKLLTVRQVYRWGGQRSVNAKVWELFKCLCEKLGIYYVHISDGRDIPCIATNPTRKMLAGENFLGRQLHERDGQLFYWAEHPREIQAPLEEFYDLAARLGREHPDTVEGAYRPFNIEYSEDGYSFKRKFSDSTDVAKAHDIVSNELKLLSGDDFLRHTGPSVMFKYFYHNGFDWCGAETMDGATESLLSFLRGATSAYGKTRNGVHLALQWSTFPHDTEQRYRRYLLSLYIPYMHDITDINTEEGLWYMEAYYAYHNRLSEPCGRNRMINRRFNRFVKTHSRTGKFYTPIAFLQGNLDGWNGFVSNYAWGIPSMPTGEDAKSWKLLNIFYPQNKIAKTGFEEMGSIFADNKKPNGVFSGTPLGCVDVVPAEHGDLSGYSLLTFAGYNFMNDAVSSRIDTYVNGGGILVCSWSHFSDTTDYSAISDYNLNIVDCEITRLLSNGEICFVSDIANGKEIKVCPNIPSDATILHKTDNGIPLVYSMNFGSGKIVFINTLCYPGNDAVFEIYKSALENEVHDILEKEPIKVFCKEDVQYTVFLQNDGLRHYYFTAVDWFNDNDDVRSAQIAFDGHSYPVSFAFGELVKLITDGKRAVWPQSDALEILELSDTYFKVQGANTEKVFVASDGEIKEYTIDLTDNPITTIYF